MGWSMKLLVVVMTVARASHLDEREYFLGDMVIYPPEGGDGGDLSQEWNDVEELKKRFELGLSSAPLRHFYPKRVTMAQGNLVEFFQTDYIFENTDNNKEEVRPFDDCCGWVASPRTSFELEGDFITSVTLERSYAVQKIAMTTMKNGSTFGSDITSTKTRTFPQPGDIKDGRVLVGFHGWYGNAIDQIGFYFGPCAVCDAEKFLDLANQGCKCTDCDAASFSDSFNAIECTSCGPGREATADRTGCVQCTPGKRPHRLTDASTPIRGISSRVLGQPFKKNVMPGNLVMNFGPQVVRNVRQRRIKPPPVKVSATTAAMSIEISRRPTSIRSSGASRMPSIVNAPTATRGRTATSTRAGTRYMSSLWGCSCWKRRIRTNYGSRRHRWRSVKKRW